MRTILLLFLALQAQAQMATWKNFGPSQRMVTSAKPCVDNAGFIYYLANADTSQFPGTKWQLNKLDSQGNLLWSKTYGNTGNFTASQIAYRNQRFYVSGDRTWNDTTRAWLSILDSSGTILQQKYFGAGDTTVVGQDLAFNADGEIAFLTQIRVVRSAPSSGQVIILDTNLNVLHRHVQIDTVSMVTHEIMALPAGGWAYVADYELAQRFDVLVTKIANDGTFLKRTQVSNGYTRGGNAIDLNSKDQIVIGGEGASAFSVAFDITLSILDTNLNVLADVYVKPAATLNDACFDMAVTPYDTYLFTGYWISPENGDTEMIVVESDSAGNRIHIDRFGSSATCIGSGIICDASGEFIAAGTDFNQAPALIISIGQAKGLATEKFVQPNLEIYPNPTQGILNVSGDFETEQWELVGPQGRLHPFHFEQSKINFEGPSGIYILQNKNNQQSLKILKK